MAKTAIKIEQNWKEYFKRVAAYDFVVVGEKIQKHFEQKKLKIKK